jgi:ribonuclease Y
MQNILMQSSLSILTAVLIGVLAGAALCEVIRRIIRKIRAKNVQQDIESRIESAKEKAENIVKSAKIEAAEEKIKHREEFNKEVSQIREKLNQTENRLSKREDTLDRQGELIAEQEKELRQQEKELQRKQKDIESKEQHVSKLIAQQKNQLLKITGMSVEDAKETLLKRLEDECEHEMSALIQRKVEEAEDNANEKCREILNTAIQRYASEQTCDVTVSTVEIPNDDMKGRIIGREGRNIRAFEKAAGVDVVVDDTPGMIIISGFHPIRREAARLAMDKLIQDGRIHPSRIESTVAQTKKEINQKVLQIGKNAAVEANISGLSNKILSMIGSLEYRTSYGQNVLRHSIEVAFLSQVMADELGLDGTVARRAGFLHDIGKAMDQEIEGGHPEIGANFLKRFNENSIVLNAVAGHHGDVKPDNPYTPLVMAADAISASRPGARRETLERYIKRLEKLEEIANGFEGVENAYAIQAGREIRVIVDANKIDDGCSTKIARDIAGKVEEQMTYPGEIQVTLLREVRCVEYAR